MEKHIVLAECEDGKGFGLVTVYTPEDGMVRIGPVYSNGRKPGPDDMKNMPVALIEEMTSKARQKLVDLGLAKS